MYFLYMSCLLFRAAETACPKVKCDDSLSDGTCYIYNRADDKIRIKECESGEVCSVNQMYSTLPLNLSTNNAKCVDQYYISDLKVAGESCKDDSQCKSNECHNSICTGEKAGNRCTDSGDCDTGLFCKGDSNKFCNRQIEEGEECEVSDECVNSASCFNGYCTRYFSLQNGSQYEDSNDSPSPLLCESGYLDSSVTCSDPPHNHRDANEPCESSSDCKLKFKNSDDTSGTCSCGLNSDGNAFCRAVQGDDEFKDFKSALLDLIKINRNCHTSINFSERCPELSDSPEISDFNRAYYTYLYRHLIVGQPDCATNTITPFAAGLDLSVEEEEEESTSTLIIVVIVIVFAVIVIIGLICFLCIKRIIYARSPIDPEQLNTGDENRNFKIVVSRMLFNHPEIKDFSKFKFEDLKNDEKNDVFLVNGTPVAEKVRYENFESIEDTMQIEEADVEGAEISFEGKYDGMNISPSSLFDKRALDKTQAAKNVSLMCEDY